MIHIEMSFQRCFWTDHHCWMVVRIWKSIGIEWLWKTSANGISIAIEWDNCDIENRALASQVMISV